MKSLITILSLCLLTVTHSFADSTEGAMPQPVVVAPAPQQPATPMQQVSTPPPPTVPSGYVFNGTPIKQWAAFTLSVLPIVFFIIFFIAIVTSVGWQKVFTEILTDKEAPPIAITEKPVLDSEGRHVHINSVPQTQMEHTYPKSASRLIMFFSSFTAILISLGIVTGSIYGYLMGKGMPDFSSVIGLVISLGIGVIPYMTSKLKGSGANASATTRNPFNSPPVNYITATPAGTPVNKNEQPPVVPPSPQAGGVQQQPQ